VFHVGKLLEFVDFEKYFLRLRLRKGKIMQRRRLQMRREKRNMSKAPINERPEWSDVPCPMMEAPNTKPPSP
jgi:hypothetical protein